MHLSKRKDAFTETQNKMQHEITVINEDNNL